MIALLEASRAPPRAGALGVGLFRVLFVPSLLAFALLPWLAPLERRPGAMALCLLLAMLFIWLAEQVFPREPRWNAHLLGDGWTGLRRLGRDGVYLFGVTQLTALLIAWVEPQVRAAGAAWGCLSLWPTTAPFVARGALAFFAVEFFSYWLHRAAHRSPLLWQFHSTHHFATELNGLKSVRTHPVDSVYFFVGRLVPMLVLGAGAEEIAAATYFGGILGILAHANVQASDRVLGWVLNFPQTHAAHHSSVLAESNTNFGCHTVVWDRLFRSFCRAPREPVVPGVAGAGARSLWQELAWPFFRRV